MPDRNYKILIADDDAQFHQQIRYAFRKNYEFEGAISIELLEKKLQQGEIFDLILLDLIFDNVTKEKIGLELIPRIKEQLPNIPIIVVTNENDVETVVDAMNLGAKNFLYKKKYDFDKWNQTFTDTLDSTRLKQELTQVKQELTQVKEQYEYKNPADFPLLGTSPAIERLRRTLKLVADEPDLTVLLTGETGVGKGVAARFLHYNSAKRRKHPFEEIHITNITRDLLESTLFGAKKGSFTGATEDIKGRLHMADKGIVFLDEIGELSLEIQVKLLQFLQTKVIRPIGTSKDVQLDVQIITATNKNLLQEVERGNFREDLYQRLKVFPIEIPPLRERREDIPSLFAYFMELPSPDAVNERFEPNTLNFLQYEYEWYGNIRELENSIAPMRIKQKRDQLPRINMDCLPDDMLKRRTQVAINMPVMETPTLTMQPADSATLNVEEQNAWNTLRAIEQALVVKNGVKKDVARMVGMKSSDSVLYFIKTTHEKYPHLFNDFSMIRDKYKVK